MKIVIGIKQKILWIILGFSFLISSAAAQISNESCSLEKPCPPGMTCFSFPNMGLRCASPDPCSYFPCPEGTQCVVALSYPAQVYCSGHCMGEECASAGKIISHSLTKKEDDPGRSCKTNEDCEAAINYCHCQRECRNKFVELPYVRSMEHCPPRDCKFGFDTSICYCENNQCTEGPRE